MNVRTLEALFSLKFDPKALKEAASKVDNFAKDVNHVMASLGGKKPIKVSIKIESPKAKEAEQEVNRFVAGTRRAMGAFAGYLAFQEIRNFFNTTTEGMVHLGKTAKFLGISVQALGEMQYAAQKTGVSLDILDDSLKELQVRAVDAKTGTGEAALAFRTLGVSTTDATGKMRKPMDLLSELADKLKALPTSSDRIWVMDAIFGDQGVHMLKMLDGGSEGLANMRREARALGYVVDEKTVEQAIHFHEALMKLKGALKAVARPIIEALLPSLTSLAEKVTSLSTSFVEFTKNTSFMRVSLIVLAGIMTIIGLRAMFAMGPILLLGAALVLAALLIDDLWTGLTGGESVLVNFYKKVRAFFRSFYESWRQWLAQSLEVKEESLRKFFVSIFSGLKEKFGEFIDWALEKTQIFGDILGALVPDFVKKGFSAAVEYTGMSENPYDQMSKQSYLAPQLPPSSIQNLSHQNVNVAVNVKSGAAPQEIGSEVQKAVRKELEKERVNAFMGVNNHAS